MAGIVFERLTTFSLRDRIAEKVRDAILSGSLQEGQRLVERKLATELGASLTAVREALIELEMEGFITKHRNAATYVTKLSLEDAEKIFALREVLERFAFEQAAQLSDAAGMEHLENLYRQMTAAARAEDYKLFLQRDYAWHEAVWQMSGNEYLQLALKRLLVPLYAFSAIRIARHGTFDLIRDAESHLPILEALKAHDPERARSSLTIGLKEWNWVNRAYVFGEGVQSAAR
jgi:DNA-binding GntR family transcriptional regulator